MVAPQRQRLALDEIGFVLPKARQMPASAAAGLAETTLSPKLAIMATAVPKTARFTRISIPRLLAQMRLIDETAV
ncbi:hypothetical protein Afe04nite_03260 [Asanoa ferruginea]|nr:hypothetical protein Afe04nite_03260 [Asanoa ferruginea]